jgi:hypothetical protein
MASVQAIRPVGQTAWILLAASTVPLIRRWQQRDLDYRGSLLLHTSTSSQRKSTQ